MITYRTGDLLQTPDRVIVHGCNCQGVMGAGVALQIRERYPEAYNSYMKAWGYAHEKGMLHGTPYNITLLGTIAWYEGSKLVGNMFTQEFAHGHFTRNVSYDAVDLCMMALRGDLEHFGETNVSMPRIGAGLGGGSWAVIEAIILHRLPDFNVTVWSI